MRRRSCKDRRRGGEERRGEERRGEERMLRLKVRIKRGGTKERKIKRQGPKWKRNT